MSRNDGGPAFPCTVEVMEDCFGMSLRDWFAGQAMAALIPLETAFENRSPAGTALEAYEYADAMLKARDLDQ